MQSRPSPTSISTVAAVAGLQVIAMSICVAPATYAQEPFTYLWVDAPVAPAGFGAASWIDFDLDGDQDLLLLGRQGQGAGLPEISLWSQVETEVTLNDDGNRRPSAVYVASGSLAGAPPLWLGQIDWADYDLDGDLDAAVIGTPDGGLPYAPTLRFLRNDGDGTITALDPGLQPLVGDVDWGDYDNDGDSDLLVTGVDVAGAPRTLLYQNDAGSFSPVDVGLPDVGLGSAAWTDLDNDRDLDVALCGIGETGDSFVAVYRNDGATVFSPLTIPGGGLLYCTVDWSDYDEDGFDDLLVSGSRLAPGELQGHTRVYRNDGGSQFVDANIDIVGTAAGTARWIDIDLDGRLDILVVGGRDVAFRRVLGRIYAGTGGDFRFVSNIRGSQPGNASFGDFDGDGDPDLAVIGSGADGTIVTSLYMNGELEVNDAPTVPDGLRSEVNGGDALLSWNPATDQSTASPSLTYNLRVGTAPGTGDVISLPVGPGGLPVRSAPGNVGHSASWRLSGLANGTYYWSVQAVDNSLHASAFSDAATFTVTASSGSKPVGTDEALPAAFRLHHPYPNPFSDFTSLAYELPSGGHVMLEVYDVLGKRVARPLDGFRPAGRHVVRLRGADAAGGALASGLYVFRLTYGAQSLITRAIVRR